MSSLHLEPNASAFDGWLTSSDPFYSFHCLFCDGWEEKGAPSSGVLAVGDASDIVVCLHVARQALRMTKQVTLYTHGNTGFTDELTKALEAAPAPMIIDSRKIVKMVKMPERAQVNLHFEDGTTKTEAFIAHKSHVKLRGTLPEQLGVEVLAKEGTIKVSPPFNQTSVKGVFAAGDCVSVIHNVTTAIQSGVAAGGGASLQIQAEALNQPGFV